MMIKSPHTDSFKGISRGTPSQKRAKLEKVSVDKAKKPLNYGKKVKSQAAKTKMPVFTPWKVALASFVIGIFGILYINHIFTTQQILQEVNLLESEYNRAKRIYNEQRLNYDRLTGPKEIYQQARTMGLVNAGPADQILIVKSE